MSPPIQIRNHPFRFLLHLEWILLGIAILSELPIRPHYAMLRWRELNLLCLVVFGLMGLRLPTVVKWRKYLYTAIGLGLILCSSLVGGLRLPMPLYVVFVIRSCLIFEPPLQSLLTALSFILATLTQIYRFQTVDRLPRFVNLIPRGYGVDRAEMLLISASLLIGLVLFFLQLLINAMLSERKSREKLAAANAQLRQYALRIEDVATLQERNRIAREIHDSLGHSLTVFNLHLEAALRLMQANPAAARELLIEAKQLGSTALQEVRQSVATLRSQPLQGRSLEAAITDLIEDFQRSTNLVPTLYLSDTTHLSIDVKTAIYRIVQEAITNIFKYANATTVEINLTVTEFITLTIQDNGIGFQSTQTTSGFGLQGMRERTLALGGTFDIVTAPNQGCHITAKFPSTLTL
jgi:signal transduction histidine kinase